MSDKHIKTVLPNKGNAWTAIIIAVPLAVIPIIIGLQQGRLIETGLWWKAPLFPFLFLVPVLAHIKAQRVILGEDSISHRKLYFYKFVTKTFRYEELDYWRIERFTLVVARKDGKVPELPHGPFADLSDVLLIPSSLYSPRTKKITEFLTSKGVKEKKKK